MKRFLTLTVIAGVLLLGAACGKAGTNTNTSSSTAVDNINSAANLNIGVTNTNTVTTNTNTATAETATVTISQNGVSPKTLTVAVGTKVSFVNNDSSIHEVASSPHPAHTDLPGLVDVIAAGSSFSFTFTQVGSWGYHDHTDPFNAAFQGTIIVQ